MPESAKTIDITILGRSYKVACEDGERDALMRTAAYLDGKMSEIRKAGKISGTERIAVMAALNIAHELLDLRGHGGIPTDVNQKLRFLQSKIDAVLRQ